ncbi:hypothetical protein FE257_010222 [Aspergillus nanangensis]|uniref:NADH-ubiquinone oxidoreductase B15 subunit n=1 Tax=Aspergillus nanangensis TaxID=2582783 RepID=A0AAD4GS80_ASPNN|nr:hypothetical protein FE257_010222 [Aspergillus nanangensis]
MDANLGYDVVHQPPSCESLADREWGGGTSFRGQRGTCAPSGLTTSTIYREYWGDTHPTNPLTQQSPDPRGNFIADDITKTAIQHLQRPPSLSPTMAGPSKSLVLDPAYQKYYELNANRYKYFRWTPRHAAFSFLYMGLIPGVLGYIAYKTEGKFEFRGKRREDTIVEY